MQATRFLTCCDPAIVRRLKATRGFCDLMHPSAEVVLDLKDKGASKGFAVIQNGLQRAWRNQHRLAKQNSASPFLLSPLCCRSAITRASGAATLDI